MTVARRRRLKLELMEPRPAKRQRAHAGSGSQDWETPWTLVRAVERDTFGGERFALDVASNGKNAKADAFYTLPSGNGLRDVWVDQTWCNPPYEEQEQWLARAHWMARCRGVHSACLVLASTSALYWRQFVWERAACDLYEGRIAFIDPTTDLPVNSNSYASALVLVGPSFPPGRIRVRSADTGALISQLPHGALQMDLVGR